MTERDTTVWWLGRIADALREAGVLLLVFAPLDLAISDPRNRPANFRTAMQYMIVLAVVLFASGMVVEWRNRPHE
jgi:hypothetical protein